MPEDTGAVRADGATCLIADARRLRRGEEDPLGDRVDRILVGTDRFIIYSVIHGGGAPPDDEDEPRRFRKLSETGDHVWLRTIYPDDYDCASKLRANLSVITKELAYICDVVDSLCRSGYLDVGASLSLRSRATEMMARAMELAYEGHRKEAEELLACLRDNITTMRDSKNRMRYVQGNLLALVVILLLWVTARMSPLATAWTIPAADGGSFPLQIVDILALGAVGAFFAVSASVSTIRVDHAVSFMEMVYTGFVRIPIGVIAAGVVIVLISGGWLLSAIDPVLLPWSYLLFGFLAGFSELFVPNALREVEAKASVSSPAGAASAS
ncbi:MAG: hypothetical protein AAFP13_06195 [Pseudomonadota bacterium]